MRTSEGFPSTMCGACCRRAFLVGLPHLANGTCVYLKDNECSIYSSRPDICRIDKGAEVCGVSKPEFYRQNAAICNAMIKQDGMDDKYLIDIDTIEEE